jgi:hypothetical protein
LYLTLEKRAVDGRLTPRVVWSSGEVDEVDVPGSGSGSFDGDGEDCKSSDG